MTVVTLAEILFVAFEAGFDGGRVCELTSAGTKSRLALYSIKVASGCH